MLDNVCTRLLRKKIVIEILKIVRGKVKFITKINFRERERYIFTLN